MPVRTLTALRRITERSCRQPRLARDPCRIGAAVCDRVTARRWVQIGQFGRSEGPSAARCRCSGPAAPMMAPGKRVGWSPYAPPLARPAQPGQWAGAQERAFCGAVPPRGVGLPGWGEGVPVAAVGVGVEADDHPGVAECLGRRALCVAGSLNVGTPHAGSRNPRNMPWVSRYPPVISPELLMAPTKVLTGGACGSLIVVKCRGGGGRDPYHRADVPSRAGVGHPVPGADGADHAGIDARGGVRQGRSAAWQVG